MKSNEKEGNKPLMPNGEIRLLKYKPLVQSEEIRRVQEEIIVLQDDYIKLQTKINNDYLADREIELEMQREIQNAEDLKEKRLDEIHFRLYQKDLRGRNQSSILLPEIAALVGEHTMALSIIEDRLQREDAQLQEAFRKETIARNQVFQLSTEYREALDKRTRLEVEILQAKRGLEEIKDLRKFIEYAKRVKEKTLRAIKTTNEKRASEEAANAVLQYLRNGAWNNHYLEGQKLLEVDATIENAEVYANASNHVPALYEGTGIVHGEIWSVDTDTLHRIWWLEGYNPSYEHNTYVPRKVTVKTARKEYMADAFFTDESRAAYGSTKDKKNLVKDGDWMKEMKRRKVGAPYITASEDKKTK
jgi:gamma-glutamylcyclotransferase (GGCT)/AIG2-like uncharacterized protein YtfP